MKLAKRLIAKAALAVGGAVSEAVVVGTLG
jgi:hypothetical protein